MKRGFLRAALLPLLVAAVVELAIAAAGPAGAAGGLAGADSAAAATAPSGNAEAGAPPSSPPALVVNPLGPVPADSPRMKAYSRGGALLIVLDSLWGIALLFAIVASGLGGRLQLLAERITLAPNLKVAVTTLLYTLLTFAGSLPVAIYGGYLREKKYGFANQTFGAWMLDRGKALLIAGVLQALFFMLLYAAIRRMPRRWWVAGSALGIAFAIVLLAVGPVFIAPLFNTFAPLKDAALRDEILAMARAQGIPAREVYEVDASRQSEHDNAYVAGLLGTQRIVLYDTILKRFAPREIRFVMGHEMGHYVLHHVWKFVAVLALAIVAGCLLVDRVSRRVLRRHPSLGIASLDQPASLPLMLLVLNLFTFLVTPAITTYSRTQEHAADRFGLEVTRDPAAAASTFIKFGRYDLGEYEVNRWVEALLYTHPSLGRRIRYAQEYARRNPEAVAPERDPASRP